MPDSNLLPIHHDGPFDEFKKSEALAYNGTQEETSNAEDDKARVAEKTNSAILPTNKPLETFHRFGDLPPEIRAIIWQVAWPMRLVSACVSKPLPQFHCRSRQPCQACVACSWRPPDRAPAVMQACREARLETQRISKPLSTWISEIEVPLSIEPSTSRRQELGYPGGRAYREKMISRVTPFNKDTDLIFFKRESILSLSELAGPPNHNDVFQVALDPEVPLVLDGHIFNTWDMPVEKDTEFFYGIEILYHRYLKTRKHIYVAVGGKTDLMLTDEGWQMAIREGLFSSHHEEDRVIPVDEKALVEKYQDLRYYCLPHSDRSRRGSLYRRIIGSHGKLNAGLDRRRDTYIGWDFIRHSWRRISRLTDSREYLPGAQLFMLQIADFLMWDQGLGNRKGGEIMELDGHLKKFHPLVQEEGFKLPDFTAVVSFQAINLPTDDCSMSLNRPLQMRPKSPEEDPPRWRLSLRCHLNKFLERWRRSP